MVDQKEMFDWVFGDSPLREEGLSMMHRGWTVTYPDELSTGDEVAYVQTFFGHPFGELRTTKVVSKHKNQYGEWTVVTEDREIECDTDGLVFMKGKDYA